MLVFIVSQSREAVENGFGEGEKCSVTFQCQLTCEVLNLMLAMNALLFTAIALTHTLTC